MEFRIEFKIKFDLLQNSIAFSLKWKVKGRYIRKKQRKTNFISFIQNINENQN